MTDMHTHGPPDSEIFSAACGYGPFEFQRVFLILFVVCRLKLPAGALVKTTLLIDIQTNISIRKTYKQRDSLTGKLAGRQDEHEYIQRYKIS